MWTDLPNIKDEFDVPPPFRKVDTVDASRPDIIYTILNTNE